MTTITRDFSLSVQTTLSFQEALDRLRESLLREGFSILSQIPFHSEFEKNVGLRWQKYTVLVVWNPFHAYHALLGDRDGGLLVPFNLVVAEEEKKTVIAATNHALFSRAGASIGVQVLARNLSRKIREIFLELALHEAEPRYVSPPQRHKEAL